MIGVPDKFPAADKYNIEWSPADRLIAFSLKGFWRTKDVLSFSDALALTVEKAAGAPFDVLVDLSDLPAQSQEVVGLHAEVMARLASSGARHHAVIGAAPLLTMQVKRASASAVAPYFAQDRHDAKRWIREMRGDR